MEEQGGTIEKDSQGQAKNQNLNRHLCFRYLCHKSYPLIHKVALYSVNIKNQFANS